jgi:hypothetical protein
METTMSKTNDKLRVIEDHRLLEDSELDAVSGGFFGDIVKQLVTTTTRSQIEDPRSFGGWITEVER